MHMSVWGKLAGVTAGYLVGGILGAVVGAVAGHFVLDALFHVAKADAPVNQNELFFLEKVAGIFGFTAAEFARIRASHMAAQNDDPWLVLGLESGADINKTKNQWK